MSALFEEPDYCRTPIAALSLRRRDLRLVWKFGKLWHETGNLPMGPQLGDDPRCDFTEVDFFALAAGDGFDAARPRRRYDAMLADIDHTPDHLLDNPSDSFYQVDRLRALKRHLKPEAVFDRWSDKLPVRRYFAEWPYCKDPAHEVFYREETFRDWIKLSGWTCEVPVKDVVLMRCPEARP